MALYHFSLNHVKRSDGHTAIAAAAYRSGEKLYDRYYGEVQDYTRKQGVVMSQIFLPDHAPKRLADRETLWYEVEKNEKRKDAQLAYSFDFALQNELTMEENIEIAERFVKENFTSRGMICDLVIHDPPREEGEERNIHAHGLWKTVNGDRRDCTYLFLMKTGIRFLMRRESKSMTILLQLTGENRKLWKSGGRTGRRSSMKGDF